MMALLLRAWRQVMRVTRACLPSGLRGRVFFSIPSTTCGVSNAMIDWRAALSSALKQHEEHHHHG
jgi:hypothetical protein